jgi:hypothetical protein
VVNLYPLSPLRHWVPGGSYGLFLVANRIPTELRRIVEFLNEQMDPAEMLALNSASSKERGAQHDLSRWCTVRR